MNGQADASLGGRPVAATVLVAVVATAVYAGLQLALDGSVSVAETASFVLIFTLVYVAGIRYLHSGEDAQSDDRRPDDAAE